MKGTRRSKVWLALAAVVAASLVLAGCPHNNLLDNSGSGGGNGAGGGRGGNGEVKLIVTNFQSNEPPAGRSASWLAGPSKSLAPDHIDLKNNSADYVFVATADGLNGEKYGPAYITLDTQGVTSLGIPDSGIWKIKVSAYEAVKLNGQGPITGTTGQQIMQGTPDAQTVVDNGTTALVLQGEATLDLGVSSTGTVVVTLTNDKVEGDGDVLVNVYFDDQDDRTKLGAGTNKYKVTVGLYDFVTGQEIKTEDIVDQTEDVGNPDVTSMTDVPKGRYQFRVTVKDALDGDKAVAYYADDITIEGNRNVTQDVHVPKLFDTPAEPTKAGVYWSEKDAGEARDGFLAYLSWEGVPYNAVGMDVQIADITKWYKNDGQDKTTFNGGDDIIADAKGLWTKIDALNGAGGNPKFDDVVTELSWRDSPQEATRFPAIYKGGSLLNGEPGIVLLMQTGHIYSVRVRSSGATATSDWLVINDTSANTMTAPKMLDTVPGATPLGNKDANKFNDIKLAKGLFDLVKLEYDLQGKYELVKGENKQTPATEADLVKYSPYGDTIQIELRYANMESPVAGDWFLYPMGSTSIDQRSKGWKGVENPIQEFNATVGHAGGNWGSYSGHSNLTLVPVGAGAGFQMQSETADTFNVLTDTTVLVDIMDTNGIPTLDELNAGTHGTNVKTTGTGLMKDTNRYILSLDFANKTGTGGTATWLFVSAGKDPAHVGTLEDKNNEDFTVVDIKVTILQNGLTNVKTFNTKDGHTAYAQLDGMASGNYTLRVEVKADSGYWVSYSTPLVIKYDTQTIAP